MDEIMSTLYSGLLTVGIGVVGFFLKRCFSSLDNKAEKSDLEKTDREIDNFRRSYATKEELKEVKTQMKDIKDAVEFLKENTVRKNDFVRVTGEISSKIDDLSTYLRGKI